MAVLEVVRDFKALRKVDGKIAALKVKREAIEEQYILTLTKKEHDALHDFLGNTNEDTVLEAGLTKEDDLILYDIYHAL